MEYLTCCVDAEAESIEEMTGGAIEIKYEEFVEIAGLYTIASWAKSTGYANTAKEGLTLKKDWHVRYHKSSYEGQECCYIVHSMIEYIFV